MEQHSWDGSEEPRRRKSTWVSFLLLFLSPRSVYDDLVNKGVIVPAQEVPPPTVPMDYSWARVGTVYVPNGVGKG